VPHDLEVARFHTVGFSEVEKVVVVGNLKHSNAVCGNANRLRKCNKFTGSSFYIKKGSILFKITTLTHLLHLLHPTPP